VPTRMFQFGMGRTIGTPDGFDNSLDFGIRYRNPGGRTKTGGSLGFSYISRPNGMIDDAYLAPVFARARYQTTLGLNIQSGSLVWGGTAKAVFDERPEGERTGGLQLGTGLSYDFLSWSASASYIFSNVGLFGASKDIPAHTGVLSARYKITKNFNIWASAGGSAVEKRDPAPNWFLSGGLGITF